MANPKICGVYKITNLVNGKFYVGSSNDIHKRWYQHQKQLNDKTYNNLHLQNAWNNYDEQNFKFEIIEECSSEVQFGIEQHYLNILKSFDDNGYNVVRQISKHYYSDNYIVKKCHMCKREYHTFSHLSKYCSECKADIEESSRDWWKTWVNKKITSSDVISWGYDSWDDFWESNI